MMCDVYESSVTSTAVAVAAVYPQQEDARKNCPSCNRSMNCVAYDSHMLYFSCEGAICDLNNRCEEDIE